METSDGRGRRGARLILAAAARRLWNDLQKNCDPLGLRRTAVSNKRTAFAVGASDDVEFGMRARSLLAKAGFGAAHDEPLAEQPRQQRAFRSRDHPHPPPRGGALRRDDRRGLPWTDHRRPDDLLRGPAAAEDERGGAGNPAFDRALAVAERLHGRPHEYRPAGDHRVLQPRHAALPQRSADRGDRPGRLPLPRPAAHEPRRMRTRRRSCSSTSRRNGHR